MDAKYDTTAVHSGVRRLLGRVALLPIVFLARGLLGQVSPPGVYTESNSNTMVEATPLLDISNGNWDTVNVAPTAIPYVSGTVNGNPAKREVGAFTVANLNDSDASGTVDKNENTFTPKKYANDPTSITGASGVWIAASERKYDPDLMRLTLHKPVPDNGGNVTLKVVSGDVKIWYSPTKDNNPVVLNSSGEIQFATNQLDKDLWVEALSTSPARKSIRITATYGTASDEVKATAVWAERLAEKSQSHGPQRRSFQHAGGDSQCVYRPVAR